MRQSEQRDAYQKITFHILYMMKQVLCQAAARLWVYVSDIIISDSNPITRLNGAPVEMSLFQIEEQNAAREAPFDLLLP